MKVIFLDIDGVLNNVKAYQFGDMWNESGWDPTCLNALEHIIHSVFDVKFVLSSTWRKLFDMEEIEAMFENRIGYSPDFIGATPTTDETFRFSELVYGMRRGKEIAVWLRDHPEVERFVILDDDSDMLEDQLPFFVQTDFEEGLTFELAEKAIEILNA